MGSTHIAELRNLLGSTKSAGNPNAKLALSRIQTEIKQRLAKGSPEFDFFVEASKGLIALKGAAHAEVRMQCLYDCAQFFYFNEQPTEGLELLQRVLALAMQTHSSTWSRKANQFLGIVLADIGDLGAALPHYCKAFDLAVQLNEPLSEASTLINLGVALNYGGLYREAIPCFQRAGQIAAADKNVSILRSPALTNLAQSHLYLGEFESGFRVIEQSLAYSREPSDAIAASGYAVREFTFVQLALELGRLPEARTHASLCLKHALASGMGRAKKLAEISQAQCEIHGGDVAAGIEALQEILCRCSSAATKEDALVALFKAYEQSEQPEKSLECLDALIAHVRTQREKGLAALLSSPFVMSPSVASSEDDLRLLRYKEARLRARVAERRALNSQIEMLERFAVTADLRDEISGEHGYRVGRLCGLMAIELGWSSDAASALELGGRLHDIGKVGVPDRILLSANELPDVDRRFICAHTAIGAELLGKSQVPQVRIAEDIARCHHEWWNGKGYPGGLAEHRIPIHARIVALADVFDALTHGRPYAPAWPISEAVNQISDRKGTQFDPELTEVFLRLISRLRAEQRDLDAYLSRGASASPFARARSRIRTMLSEHLHNQRQGVGALQ